MGQSLSTEHNKFSPEGTALKEAASDLKEAYIEAFRNASIWELTDQAASSTETSTELPSATEEVGTAAKDFIETNPIGRFLKAEGFFDVDPTPSTDYIDLEDVHPIFALSNFDTTLLGEKQMQKAWNAFRPALALATKMITAPEARRAFWHRLVFGRLIVDPATGKQTLVSSEHEENFSEASHAFDLWLEEMAQKLTLYVLTPSNEAAGLMIPNRWNAARTIDSDVVEKFLPLSRFLSEPESWKYLNCFFPFLGLTVRFFELALRPSSRIHAGSDPWHGDNLIFQLELASDLTHEIAHLVWWARTVTDDGRPHNDPEPFTFLSDVVSEAGFAWNFWSMGCLMNGEYRPVTTKLVPLLTGSSWQHAYGNPKLSVPIGLRWAQRWFLKETWEEDIFGEVKREALLWGIGPLSSGKGTPRYMLADCVLREGISGPKVRWDTVLYVDGHPRLTETGKTPYLEDQVLNRYYLGPGSSNVDVWWSDFRNAMKKYLEFRDISFWQEPWDPYKEQLHKPRVATGVEGQEQDSQDTGVDPGVRVDTEGEAGSGNADEPPKDANEDPNDLTTTEADENNSADADEDPSGSDMVESDEEDATDTDTDRNDSVIAEPNEDNASGEYELTDIDKLCVQLSELGLDERTVIEPDKVDDPDKLDPVEELCDLLSELELDRL